MKTLYFDCFCGASGDMIVGSLLDIGADFRELEEMIRSMPISGFKLKSKKVKKKGIAATQFSVIMDDNVKQPHRHLHHVLEIINGGNLPEKVKTAASETFRLIAEAEATVHATTVDHVHFHEVGAIDSIVDIVGAHIALYLLQVDTVFSSPLLTGFGSIQCDHGVMPVPAPATALLLRGIPWSSGDVATELLTPTGAALLRYVVKEFRPMLPMRVDKVGYGSGTRDLPDRANVLRVFLGESCEVAHVSEEISVIETNVDDMTSETLAPLVGDLIDAGARDAFLCPVLGKKGRMGFWLTVLCDADKVSKLANLIFCSTSTFGIRIRSEHRICLEREWKWVKTDWGKIRVKIGKMGDNAIRRAPEFEDCRAAAVKHGRTVLEVYQAALSAAVRGEFCDVHEK